MTIEEVPLTVVVVVVVATEMMSSMTPLQWIAVVVSASSALTSFII